jgi:hypothetical protein
MLFPCGVQNRVANGEAGRAVTVESQPKYYSNQLLPEFTAGRF